MTLVEEKQVELFFKISFDETIKVLFK